MNKIIALSILGVLATPSVLSAECLEVGQEVTTPDGKWAIVVEALCDPNMMEIYTVTYEDGSKQRFELVYREGGAELPIAR